MNPGIDMETLDPIGPHDFIETNQIVTFEESELVESDSSFADDLIQDLRP
jgi:hypothetical protein